MTIPTSIIPKPNINLVHHRIHEGNHFVIHKVSTGINVANPKYFLIIPPPVQPDGSIIEMHLIFEVDSDIGGTLEFFENPTVTNNGTALAVISNNRRSSTVSQVLIFEDPIVTNDGTSLFQERKGTATIGVGATLGEFERDDEEFILHQVDTYILKFTPLANNANITMELNWYDNRPSSPIPVP